MSFVVRLQRALGHHAPTIEVRDVGGPTRPGGELRATIRVAAGARAARLEPIRVRLVEERLIYTAPMVAEFDFWQKVVGFSLPLVGRMLAPGEAIELPITLSLPAALEPTERHRRYRLSAHFGRLGPRHAVIVGVLA